jgi:hypothetical protein
MGAARQTLSTDSQHADVAPPALLLILIVERSAAKARRASGMEQCTHDHKFENLSRKELLHRLEIGDVFYAVSESGATAICLVTGRDEDTVTSRRITTQDCCKFDRTTGKAVGEEFASGAITSVEPLPMEILNTYLAMDRQYRLGHRDNDTLRLTDSQKTALLFVDDFYAKYPLGE